MDRTIYYEAINDLCRCSNILELHQDNIAAVSKSDETVDVCSFGAGNSATPPRSHDIKRTYPYQIDGIHLKILN